MLERLKKEILCYLPDSIREVILRVSRSCLEEIIEIRLRIGKPIILRAKDDDCLVKKIDGSNYILNNGELSRIFEMMCKNSIYAWQDEIANGFLTLRGGHRVGISGKAIYKNSNVYSIRDISGLNIRVARQIIGAGDDIIKQLIEDKQFISALIVSPPGFGKTTILRDLVRQMSNGLEDIKGVNISLVDERSEIAAVFNGIPQNDIGIRTDVMDGISKYDGINMMVRSMGPEFIATDEIGEKKDVDAILYAVNSGVKILATAHGSNMDDLMRRDDLARVINKGIFNKIIFLNKGGSVNACI